MLSLINSVELGIAIVAILILISAINQRRSGKESEGKMSFKKRWGWLTARVVTALEFILVPMIVALFNCTFSPYFKIETEAKKEEDMIVANFR